MKILVKPIFGSNEVTFGLKSIFFGRPAHISISYFPRCAQFWIIRNRPDFSQLIKYLEKATDLHYKITIPKSRTGIDDGFYNKIVDIALVPPLKYLDLNRDYGVKAKLKLMRYNKDYYQSMFIINKKYENEIKELSDIKGKAIAFTHHDSASGYIIPHEILYIRKIVPKNILFAFSHKNVVNLVYKNEVQAGVTFYQDPGPGGEVRDGRFLIQEEYPDVKDKVKILYISGKIPNDPMVFKKDFPEDIENKFTKAFMDFIETPEGKELFYSAYNVDGFSKTDDIEYEDLRMLMKEYFED